MPYLKYYSKERKIFPNEMLIMMEEQEIKEFYNDACYKFVLHPVFIHFKNLKSYDGLYNEYWNRITLKNKNLFTVVHELAHHLDSQENGKYHNKGRNRDTGRSMYRKAHTKKHRECMIRLFDYYKFWKNPSKYNDACKITISGEIKNE